MSASLRWTSADLSHLPEDGKRRGIIDVYRRDEVPVVLAEVLVPGDTLTSPLLPGFEVPLDRLCIGIPFGTDDDE